MQKTEIKNIPAKNKEQFMNFDFQLKKSLSDEELVECFDFMKTFLVSLYGEESIGEKSFGFWKAQRTNKENIFFIKILKRNEVYGYAEITILDDETLYFSNIIIKEGKRRTMVVYEFVKYVLNLEQFKDFNEIYLHINKKNKSSLNTWMSLGLVEVFKGKRSNKYKLLRSEVENYFSKPKSI